MKIELFELFGFELFGFNKFGFTRDMYRLPLTWFYDSSLNQ